MTPTPTRQVVCPHCGRRLSAKFDRFGVHSTAPRTLGAQCPMSGQRVPVTGMTAADLEARAYMVFDWADQMQGSGDPAIVVAMAKSLPQEQLWPLLLVALCAVYKPADATVDDALAWVWELDPQRRVVPA